MRKVRKMGIFSKKDKTPEKELFEAIELEIQLILYADKDQEDLLKIVKKAYKSGASCDEIQRVYRESLPIYRQKSDVVNPGLRDVIIDGLSFQMSYQFIEVPGSKETSDYTCKNYGIVFYTEEDGEDTVARIDIYVFNRMNMDQAIAILPISKKTEFFEDTTYGDYTGIAGIRTGMFNTKHLEWFIYEREGKTVAINGNTRYLEVYIDKIANGWAL